MHYFVCESVFRINIQHVSSILCVSGVKEKINDVFTVLIKYLDDPDSDPTVSCVCVPVLTRLAVIYVIFKEI